MKKPFPDTKQKTPAPGYRPTIGFCKTCQRARFIAGGVCLACGAAKQ